MAVLTILVAPQKREEPRFGPPDTAVLCGVNWHCGLNAVFLLIIGYHWLSKHGIRPLDGEPEPEVPTRERKRNRSPCKPDAEMCP